MKTEPVEFTERLLEVEGSLWGGGKFAYSYRLKVGQNPTTLAEASKLAGDFEYLTKAKILTTVKTLSSSSKLLK